MYFLSQNKEYEAKAKIYRDNDADINIIKNKLVAIIGYGNQGRAQAMNLRDSGIKVIIGNVNDEYKEKALKDKFEVFSISDASNKADIIMMLIPDEIQADIFNNEILPNLKKGKVLEFATGYNITYKDVTGINPPEYIDIIMVAPRMIGLGVRETYISGEGYYSFIAIEQDASGNAKKILLALAKALGTTKKGAIETTFAEEAHLDLFTEQAFGPALGNVLRTSVQVLLDAGYPPEAIFVELYMSGELSFTLKEIGEIGLIEQMDFHSQTSQYGSLTRGVRYFNPTIEESMKKSLNEIQSGKFAREWAKKQKSERDPTASLKKVAKTMPFTIIEKKVREKLKKFK
ncbi:MAG: ketol-acid reductoisomerase [Candidatus Lokiarchaeota archaeon]|nr:ketol-acid reductoisomerase [Candidatus Lokiarchaeota archaeon]